MDGDNVGSEPATRPEVGGGTGGNLPATERGTSPDSLPLTEPEAGARADSGAQPDTVVHTPADSGCPTEPEAGAGTGGELPATAVVADDDPSLDPLRRWEEPDGPNGDVSPDSLGVHDPALVQSLRERINRQECSDASLPVAPTLPVTVAGARADGTVHPGAGSDATDRADRGQPGTRAVPPGDPPCIGRHRVIGVLGEGGFGRVYRAHDTELDRDVAIKVPIAGQASPYMDVATYLREARILAQLEHPHIVPVYDVGHTDDGRGFVVSKYMEGGDLAGKLRRGRLAFVEAAGLVATLCKALHYTHRRDLFHRDIKPANILLDAEGLPYLADFGLALKDEDLGKGARYVGTAAYMSPEQARGEGHRVDGRSDIFSMGIVLYELLTGRRPFRGDSHWEVLEQIVHAEPRPPRQIDDTIPAELERICLKALAKRASERYTTARDLAEDLGHYLETAASAASTGNLSAAPAAGAAPTLAGPTPPLTWVSTDSGLRTLRIVPKGLGSFDEQDADFFLELLPGPRDRDGLPEGLRFWKTRIEAADPDRTFRVGLIYGPSGCGKSSMIKAGLLPRLAAHVAAIYIEATGAETEARLLKGIRRLVLGLPASAGLAEAMTILRRGPGLPPGRKVLIVLDQFEQWLFAKRAEPAAELVAALRQCDGERLQVLCLVRDDFWMAATRFFRALEIELLPDRNVAAVDLFEPKHARRVLAAYGRAYEALPPRAVDLGREPGAFLDQVVAGLTQDGRVAPVRLAMFAEMVKSKPWMPATLRELGGMDGVGVKFLEETFSSARSNPNHRYHQKAAQAVLKALLPETDADIKGRMRPIDELRARSGYSDRPDDFADLIRMLDTELHLITPVDPEGSGAEDAPSLPASGQSYQLTHDYLVHALRDWLTRKQRETIQGRAELRLATITSSWSDRPGPRRLPSPLEWLSIIAYTRPAAWSSAERRMMRAATRHYAVRALAVAVLGAVVAIAFLDYRNRSQAHSLVSQLLVADTGQVPAILAAIDADPGRTGPALDRIARDPRRSPKERLHAYLSLLPGSRAFDADLLDRLLQSDPDELIVIAQRLRTRRAAFVDRLWTVASAADTDRPRKLRAACALAALDADNGRWEALAPEVSNSLVLDENMFRIERWLDALRPVRKALLEPLAAIFRDRKRAEDERFHAAVILQQYAADQPRFLVELIKDADLRQSAMLLPALKPHRSAVIGWLAEELDEPPPAGATEGAKDALASQQANCAVALLLLDQPGKVWPLLRHSPEPRLRGHLLDRIPPLGVDPRLLAERLHVEGETSARRALMLALAEYRGKGLAVDERAALERELLDAFRKDPDPGIHSAAERALRDWGRGDQVDALVEGLKGKDGEAGRRWYVNGQGHTMVIIDPRGQDPVLSYSKRIDRVFALATKEVSVPQWVRFRPRPGNQPELSPFPDCPISVVTWYDAAAYCRWLSEKEHLPESEMCYPPLDQIKEGMRLPADYLRRTGYRLPTQAEAEYACRAGAVTSRFFGSSDQLLPRYAYFRDNSRNHSWPVGSLWPNDLGLFDILGNALEWCQECHTAEHEEREQKLRQGTPPEQLPVRQDREDTQAVSNSVYRPLRGGDYSKDMGWIRSGRAEHSLPVVQFDSVGFRVARTQRPRP